MSEYLRLKHLTVWLALLLWPLAELVRSDNLSGALHLHNETLAATKLHGIGDGASLVFQVGDDLRSFPQDQILLWDSFRHIDANASSYVLLTDGSVLPGLLATIDLRQLQLQHRYFGLLTLPLTSVAGLVLNDKPDRVKELLLSWIDRSSQSDDTVYLQDGSLLRGAINSFGESRSLVVDSAQTLQLRTITGETRVSFGRVQAIRLSPVLHPIRKTLGRNLLFVFDDGTQLNTVSLNKARNDELTITTTSLTLKASSEAAFVEHCIAIQSLSSATTNSELLQADHFSDIRGRGIFSRKQWLYFQKSSYGWIDFGESSATNQVILIPSCRVRIEKKSGVKVLTGTIRLRQLANPFPVVADVLGNQMRQGEFKIPSSLVIKLVTIRDDELLELFTLRPTTNEAFPLNVNVTDSKSFIYSSKMKILLDCVPTWCLIS